MKAAIRRLGRWRNYIRWHVWLGWLVAIPLLLWTVSGLIMVARPIEDVRGTPLRAEAMSLPSALRPVPPRLDGRSVARLELAMRGTRPVWLIAFVDEGARAADAATGELLPPVSALEARAIGTAALKNPAAVTEVRRFAADANPIDLRRDRPAWRVALADGARVYVDADTGAVLAVRTQFWRIFDFFWGLHIMDPVGREDTHHPLLIGFAALAVLATLLGLFMLFVRPQRQRLSSTSSVMRWLARMNHHSG